MKEKTQYTDLERFYLHAPYIHRVRNSNKQTRAGIAMAAGLLLMAIPPVTHMSSDFLAMLTIALGVFLLLGALIQWAKGTTGMIYTPTGESLTLGAVTYDYSCCPMLRSLLEEGECEDLEVGMSVNPNGGIRVDYLLSADHRMLAVSAKRFENLMWLPFADHVVLFTDDEARQAAQALGID